MSTKTFYVTVKIKVEEGTDVNDTAENMDYSFDYPGILETEIVEVSDKR